MSQVRIDSVPLGRSGHHISSIGLGCTTFGREIDEDQCRRILDYAVQRGITLIDTAESYGGGNARENRRQRFGIDEVREVSDEMSSSERIIGRWLQARGDSAGLTITTKCSTGGRPENVTRAIAASRDNLQVDCIDLYMMHQYDEAVPAQETLHALHEAVAAGHVRTIGCSNHTRAQLEETLQVSASNAFPRYEIVENNCNLATPEVAEIFPLCEREQVTFLAYSPLGAGFLTGKYVNDKGRLPPGTRFHTMPGHADIYFNARNFRVVEQLRAKATAVDESMVFLAGAWVVANPGVDATLFGARTTAHIDNALRTVQERLDDQLWQEMASWE